MATAVTMFTTVTMFTAVPALSTVTDGAFYSSNTAAVANTQNIRAVTEQPQWHGSDNLKV
jgi:hypothetical protein